MIYKTAAQAEAVLALLPSSGQGGGRHGGKGDYNSGGKGGKGDYKSALTIAYDPCGAVLRKAPPAAAKSGNDLRNSLLFTTTIHYTMTHYTHHLAADVPPDCAAGPDETPPDQVQSIVYPQYYPY